MALAAGAVALGVAAPSASADTVVVTVMNDSTTNNGQCSVREAVTATNTNTPVNSADDCDHDGTNGKDTIQLPAGTAAISGAASDDANISGDLDIEAGKGLTIIGVSASQSKLDGDVDRLIDQESGPLTLKDLTVQDGDAGMGSGGDVLDRADKLLTLNHVTIRDGEASLGGGVRVEPGGELVMNRSIVTNNIADGSQGGAGIHAGVPVTITDSTVSENHATGSFGPAGMRIEGGPSKITGSLFIANTTDDGGGGAIEVTSSMSGPRNLTITDTVFTQNHAEDYRGGGIYYGGGGVLKLTRTLFTSNTARSGAGAIEAVNDSDDLKISKSVISGNTISSTNNEAIGGAGITADGKSTISQSEIVGNIATSPNNMASGYGGGIRNGGQMRITRSTLFDNQSPDGFGGAIQQDATGAKLTISNSTFNENTASGDGGAISSSLDADLHVYNSTFAANDAGPDGDSIKANGTGVATIKGSIFAKGTGDDCDGGVLVSKGYNVDKGGSCAGTGPHDLVLTDPKLGQYDVHGGPIAGTDGIATQLHLYSIKKSSPAKNLIPKKKCKDDKGKLMTDERGHKRPGGKKCDAGAFEV